LRQQPPGHRTGASCKTVRQRAHAATIGVLSEIPVAEVYPISESLPIKKNGKNVVFRKAAEPVDLSYCLFNASWLMSY
jgi:hypothetical protein